MLKKKLVTIVAAAFCVALVTAQSSAVNKVTTGLIGDGAIDSFKFGTEDGSGVIFGQYNNEDKQVVLGWGNLLSDTLWLSVYDAWNFNSAKAQETAQAYNKAQADDGINVDYTTTTRKVLGSYYNWIVNTLGIGAGINNTLGFQLEWKADYKVYKKPSLNSDTPDWGTSPIVPIAENNYNDLSIIIKEEVNEPDYGCNRKKEWTKFANNKIKNNFTVNFKGVGIEDLGDIDFFVKLNKVSFDWESINRTGDYTASTTINGKTTSETTITGKNTINTLKPGLNFDLGLNVIDNDIATVKFVYEDDFSMSFKPSTNESTKTVKDPIASASTETTTTNSYKVEYGKYLQWENKFEPKLAAEFNVAKPLKLKAQLALPVTLTQTIDEVGKYESTTQVEIFDRTNGYSYLSSLNPKTTETGKYQNSDGEIQNKTVFETKIAPKLSAGFVYEVTPGKFNVNFGVSAQPTYTWTTKTYTNANINTVTVTENKDQYGNVKTSKTVNVITENSPESKTTNLSTDCLTEINLGATWFFTENVRFDAYLLNNFGYNSLFTLSRAGASVTVKF